jgi:hypothetical protein
LNLKNKRSDKMSSDFLRPESIEWAWNHLKKFGDSDIFPVPFEYEAISYFWPQLKKEVEKIDLSTYNPRAFQPFYVPKQYGGYRYTIQLDPIDSILYAALAFESANVIEQSRIPINQRISCSYRVEIDENGKFFRKKNGWDDFHNRSGELATSGEYEYIVTADIADFYNQISHHRIENALELSGVEKKRAKNIENYLTKLTAGSSRGIPVGPSGSIIFSEACLNDVDVYLYRNGYIHTRYVDDFRIFCRDIDTSNTALHDLTRYLHTTHRLALQTHKTRILTPREFIRKEHLDPKEIENDTIQSKIDEITQFADPYFDSGTVSIEKPLIEEIIRNNLIELLEACIESNPIHYGLAKYLLRRATVLKTRVLQKPVLDNFKVLIPIIREVSQYLKSVSKINDRDTGMRIHSEWHYSGYSSIPYIQLWLIDVLIATFPDCMEREISDLCKSFKRNLGVRPYALYAMKKGYVDWIRQNKETWQNNSPWDKRAIIWATQSLSNDEVKAWTNKVQNSSDVLDQIIAKATYHKKNNISQNQRLKQS